MRLFVAMALVFGVTVAGPTAAGAYVDVTPIHKHAFHAHHAFQAVWTKKIQPGSTAQIPAAPAPPGFFLHIAPYPPGQGDTDGLSRNPDDCNKGCIGGNRG